MPLLRARRTRPWHLARWEPRRQRTWRRLWNGLTPARLLVVSFAGLVLVGTAGLLWLPGLYAGDPLPLVDALFMATSAVCVTGLAVVNPATEFTFFGQLWLLVLVQAGGLGLLTLTSGVLLTIGRRLSLRHEELVRSVGEAGSEVDYRRLVRQVLRFTFVIEAGGFVLLYVAWVPRLGLRGAVWPALFHAVSAFCNAGFSTFADSLVGFQRDWVTLAVLSLLIVLGGLGFLTLSEFGRTLESGTGRRLRLSLHSRIVFTSTLVALVAGAVLFGLYEWEQTLAGLPRGDKVMNAIFASVTARTAGFNAVDYGAVTAPALFATMVLMIVGGAPGSTAGGVKITTVALLLILAAARLRGRAHVSAFHRTVPDETLGRAIGLLVIAGILVVGALFLLIAVDPRATSHDVFLRYMFEAISAFATVGLSMNLTPELAPDARLVIVVLMFIGRVGVLTLAAALTLERRALPFRFAKEDVAIG